MRASVVLVRRRSSSTRAWMAARAEAGSKKVAAVAAEVGYESEAAFSRAFKRRTGHAPAGWRRMRQGTTGGDAIPA